MPIRLVCSKNPCKIDEFEIQSFRPKPQERLIVKAKGWGNPLSELSFTNIEDKSSLEISAITEYNTQSEFQNDFYNILNPENILEFLKGCFY